VALEGTIVVASGGSGYITRNPDAFAHNYGVTEDSSAIRPAPYHLHKIAPASQDLSELITTKLNAAVGEKHTVNGTNVTAESFYSSQGRLDANFDDENGSIMDTIRAAYPSATTLEMETFMLLHLARCSKISIKASAAAIVVANRPTGHVIDGDLLERLESEGGRAILQAITTIEL
jgi:uridine phosphorylase